MAKNPAEAENDSMTDAETNQSSTARARSAPAPDDSRKPDSPTEVQKPAWKYVLKRTLREYSRDQCPDLAAALTYFGVLSLFPALLALVSLLGVVGQAEQTTQTLTRDGARSGQPAEWPRPSASRSSSSPARRRPAYPDRRSWPAPSGPPPAMSGRSDGP